MLLVNGSTQGIHVMIQLYCRPGSTLLLPRNAHHSALQGCVLGGVQPVWIPAECLDDGRFFVREEAVLAALEENPHAGALLLTRPDYYGGCIPMERIARKAAEMGIPVIVDEAHGAHLPWGGEAGLPRSAGAMGASAWTQSVHKTLPGLTGTAVLHLRDAADLPRTMRILRREQTSSPSFLLMESIDDARAFMDDGGAARLTRVAELADGIRAILPETPYRDAHALWAETGYAYDRTRLVLEAPQGGERLQEQLQTAGIDAEMHDPRRVVLIASVMDDEDKFARLADALMRIRPDRSFTDSPAQGYDELPPVSATDSRTAALCDAEAVPLTKAAGRIAAAAAGLYPPGIPLVCPGEYITPRTAAMLAAASPRERFGTEGDCMPCVP